MTLGTFTWGDGPNRALVLHDWMGDHHTWDPVLPYLDVDAFAWVFADLRGYGSSRGLPGRYDLREAADDVVALATSLGWTRFHLVGHSMSTLIVQQVAADAPDRVATLTLIAPVAPGGMGAPEPVIGWLEASGGDPSTRASALADRWRHGPGWRAFKLRRWAESAAAEAARGYVRMFAASSVSGDVAPDLRVLAVIGEHDEEPFREETVRRGLARYANLELAVCRGAGHYPMQETPPALAAVLEAFLA